MSVNSKNYLSVEKVQTLANQVFQSDSVEVVSFNLKPFSDQKLGYLGVHELLTIETRDKTDESSKNTTFFVKSISKKEQSFDQMIFLQESTFFSELVPKLLENCREKLQWCPKCYLATDNILVMEDLRAQGFKMPKSILEPEQLKSAVTVLAHFHSTSMVLEKKLKKPLSDLYPGLFRIDNLYNKEGIVSDFMLAGIEVAQAVASSLGLRSDRLKEAYEIVVDKAQPTEGQKNVLCHCDAWFNNIMFDSSVPVNCRLIDFQLVSYTSYALDFVKFLYFNTDRKMREKMKEELIELYHTVIVSNLKNFGLEESDSFSLQKLQSDVEDKILCGMVTAVQEFPILLMKKEFSAEYAKDEETFQNFTFGSRKEFVLKIMSLDEEYKSRIEEAVVELVEHMQK